MAVEAWMFRTAVPAARAALRAKRCDGFEPLPSWVRGTVMVHLLEQERRMSVGLPRLEVRLWGLAEAEQVAGVWPQDVFLRSLLSERPMTWFVELLNAHAASLRWQGGDDGEESLEEVLSEVLRATLRLGGVSTDEAVGTFAVEKACHLLEYVRASVVGAARVMPAAGEGPPNADRVARRFVAGVELLFESDGLGAPTAADLALLSLISGFEQDDAGRVRERWRKRLKAYGVEKSQLTQQSSSPP
jgi:hypothetical protein